MTDIVIQAENLGKHYTTGHQAEKGRDVALRDGLVNNALRNQLCISTLVLRSAECADHRAPGGGSLRDARVVGMEREAIVGGTAALLENASRTRRWRRR